MKTLAAQVVVAVPAPMELLTRRHTNATPVTLTAIDSGGSRVLVQLVTLGARYHLRTHFTR